MYQNQIEIAIPSQAIGIPGTHDFILFIAFFQFIRSHLVTL